MKDLNVVEVETAVVNLAAAYPSISALITLPNLTPEGRTSHALQLGGGAPGSRDCVMIIGGVHAREWSSCEIAISFAADLLDAYTNNKGLMYDGKSFTPADIQNLLNGLHVIVFPLVNPDGRNFSQTVDAGWRRSRNTASSGGSPACIGVDLNRNYDFLFDFMTTFASGSPGRSGASTDPCDPGQRYHGPSAFSEPETQNVRWLLDTNPRTRWFLDLHSFGGQILINWGDDDNQSTNPAMNFRNASYNSVRGFGGDTAYQEFMPADDAAVGQKLAVTFRDALQAVRGKTYLIAQSLGNSGTSKDYVYSRHFVDPSKGKIYGYTIEWGDTFQPGWPEMDLVIKDVSAGLIAFCLAAPCAGGIAAVALGTPMITFNDVPAGVETSRAAVFSVQTCGPITLSVTAGPKVTSGPGQFNLPLGGVSLGSAPTADERDARIWVSFKGTNPGDVTTGTITIHFVETGQDFVIPIHANTIAQPTVASVLVLDKSGSMDFFSGIPGKTRLDVLHLSAPTYVALLPDKDGIGVVSFDTDAYPVMPVETAAPNGRADAVTAIAGHTTNPAGLTAIGDGVELAHNTLPLSGFERKAIVVFTDGEETASKYIADVAGLINERVFAIGLGTVQEVNPVALNSLVNNSGGYLLMTDALGPNDGLRLGKYFVQILAGVTNTEIVIDPDGMLFPGVEAKIAFDLNSTDYSADAIVLSPAPGAFDFELETPAGIRINHNSLGGVVGVGYVTGTQISFYRLSLPIVLGGAGAHQGRWYVVLKIRQDPRLVAAMIGLPYHVIVQARSSLTMAAYLTQPSFEPGTTLDLRATLQEIGLPVERRAKVQAEVTRPDGTQVVVPLLETDPGVFEGSTKAPLSGIYPVRFRAAGQTLRGTYFTREQLRSGMAWRVTDQRPSHGRGRDFLRFLLADPAFLRWLEGHRIEPS